MPHPAWIDWMVGFSTAATAVTTMTLTYLQQRRERMRRLPIVEPTLKWEDSPEVGRHICANLRLTNRLNERIVVDEITVQQPRKSTMAVKATTPHSISFKLLPGTSATVRSGFVLPPTDALSTARETITAYISPPPGWSSGTVVIRLTAKSMASATRFMRIAVKSRMPELTAMQNDANAIKRD